MPTPEKGAYGHGTKTTKRSFYGGRTQKNDYQSMTIGGPADLERANRHSKE